MDWYLDAPEQVAELRREIAQYLGRHAAPGSDAAVADAELVVSEAVGNAVRHTGGPVWISLTWPDELPLLRVLDLGPGFELPDPEPTGPEPTGPERPDAAVERESGRGLPIIRALAPEVVTSLRSHAGTALSVRLDVPRRTTRSFDPPRRHHGTLPDLDEARPEGGFGKESFLRALVVQLSRAVEESHGHDAAEAAVAQVGTDVGGQMEAEFRLAEGIVGRLSPEDLGRCYVRLKHAIDGEFRVVEATPERVVLENTRCPFGETVRKAPALCRMTSSVFGGIAARNSDHGAAVLLEERIAVGDPGCRVVVHLGPPPLETEPFLHRYGSPTTSEG